MKEVTETAEEEGQENLEQDCPNKPWLTKRTQEKDERNKSVPKHVETNTHLQCFFSFFDGQFQETTGRGEHDTKREEETRVGLTKRKQLGPVLCESSILL